MPWGMTVRPLTTRLAVTPKAAGGYARAERPNPNDPVEALKRRGMMSGTATALPVGRAGNANPTIDALGENMALQQRAMEGNRAQVTERAAAPLADYRKPLYLADPKLEALKQALYEAGADRLMADGGSTGMVYQGSSTPGTYDSSKGTSILTRRSPGFFGTQTPQMSRAMNTMSPRERLLVEEMAKQSTESPETSLSASDRAVLAKPRITRRLVETDDPYASTAKGSTERFIAEQNRRSIAEQSRRLKSQAR